MKKELRDHAIEFAEWITRSNYIKIRSENYWFLATNFRSPKKTTQQLYRRFLKSKVNKQNATK